MAKVSRIDAFKAITESVSKNDTKTANAIFILVSKSIAQDRKNNEYTEFIELTTKQKKIFKGDLSKFLNESNEGIPINKLCN